MNSAGWLGTGTRRSWRVGRLMLLAVSLLWTLPATAQDLRIGLAAEPTSLDPHFHVLTPNIALHQHIYEHLIETDSRQRLRPGLAESWALLEDGTTWELKLRANVKWHDGSPFTADDVLFSFARVPKVPNSPNPFTFATKDKTLVKVDDLTVRITTGRPSPLTPNDLAQVFIVSKKHGGAATAAYNSGKAAIGTGPFKLGAYVPGQRISLVRNDTYWGTHPIWASVTMRPLMDGAQRIAALLANEVDVIEEVPTGALEKLKSEPRLSLAEAASNRSIFFQLDQFRPTSPFITGKDGAAIANPLLDVRVRRALSKAINRETIANRVMAGAAVPAAQFLPDGYFGVAGDLKPPVYDPEGAKKLLADAGYPNGFRLTLHGPSGRYTNDLRILEAVAQMFTRIGVETTAEALPPPLFFQRATTGGAGGVPEFSMILVGWSPGSGENSGALRPQLTTYNPAKGNGTSNRGRYSNAAFDAAVMSALETADEKARADLLAKATRIAAEDVAWIPIHYQINTWASRRGFVIEPRADEATFAMNVTRRPGF